MQIYNLPEFAELYHIPNIYGATVACFDLNQDFVHVLEGQTGLTNFYSFTLLLYGDAHYVVGGNHVHIDMHDLLVMPPHTPLQYHGSSQRTSGICLIVEASYFEEMLRIDDHLRATIPIEIFRTLPKFHLDESKASELCDHFQQIKRAIRQPHIYKAEMIKYMVHISQLFLAEQLYGDTVATHDLKHKENIFKIFIYLAAQNFRRERQVKFYADKLNITGTYLSRTVKEVSGNTVYGYLSSFLYNEACKLLKTTTMTMGEIADELSFNDQSAFTNFFKQKAGMSPLAYRASK